jgi:hypothetical protein
MFKMTFDRKLTLVSVVFAGVASLAATVQSYLSWSGRNDALRSAVLAEIAKDCHDIVIDAGNSLAPTVPPDYTQKMMEKATALDLLVNAIDSTYRPIYGEVESFLDDEFDRAAEKDGLQPGKAEAFKQEVEQRFIVNLTFKCSEVIRKQL